MKALFRKEGFVSKPIIKLGLFSLLLCLLVPAFAGAEEAPVAAKPAVAAPASDAVAKAVVASLFQVKSTACPSKRDAGPGINPGKIEIIVAPPPPPPPPNLAACGNCPGVCNSDPGCVGKLIGDRCDPTDPAARCFADGAGCTGFNCCECI